MCHHLLNMVINEITIFLGLRHGLLTLHLDMTTFYFPVSGQKQLYSHSQNIAHRKNRAHHNNFLVQTRRLPDITNSQTLVYHRYHACNCFLYFYLPFLLFFSLLKFYFMREDCGGKWRKRRNWLLFEMVYWRLFCFILVPYKLLQIFIRFLLYVS